MLTLTKRWYPGKDDPSSFLLIGPGYVQAWRSEDYAQVFDFTSDYNEVLSLPRNKTCNWQIIWR